MKAEKAQSIIRDKENFIFAPNVLFLSDYSLTATFLFTSAKIIDFILKMCDNKNMQRIGILGGTFDPVHVEHEALARAALVELNLDKLVVMPTFISPHKTEAKASPASDRLNMLNLAFKDDEKIEVSDFEILKEGKSYTYQTVEWFKAQGAEDLFFICGGDMLTDFKNWRFPERILSACTLAVFARENFATDFEGEREYFLKTFGKEFIKLNYFGKDESSTKIRVYSMLNLPLNRLVSQKVEEYIKDNDLYKADDYYEYVKLTLPEKRLKHTANVVVTALKKANELGLDKKKVETACVLHDCAKYLDYKSIKDFELEDGVPEPVIHSFLGAHVAKTRLGIEDEEIIDAIRFHTSGKPNMSLLGKLVFVADMVEEGRNYEGVEYLRELYNKSDFEFCFKECLREEYIHLLNKKGDIYSKTLDAYNYYINKKEG